MAPHLYFKKKQKPDGKVPSGFMYNISYYQRILKLS